MKIKISFKKKKNENSSDRKLCDFLAMTVLGLFLTNAAYILSSFTGVSHELVSNLAKVVIACFFIRALPIVLKRLSHKMIFFVFISIIVTLLNLLLFPETNRWFVNTAFSFYTMCFSSFLVCSAIKDFSLANEQIVKISRLIAIGAFIILVLGFMGLISMSSSSYSMGFGYACVLPFLFLTFSFFQKQNLWDLFGLLCILFAILINGSRGPILGMGLFGVFFGIRYLLDKKNYLLIIVFIVLIFSILFFYKEILGVAIDVCESLNINSRTLRLFVNNLYHDSGRNNLYSVLLTEIKENPLQIRGINAEYIQIYSYAHNIIIELLYQYGVVVGGIIVVFCILLTLKTLMLKNVDSKTIMIWIFAFATLPSLMVSGSLWTNQIFWMWIALII